MSVGNRLLLSPLTFPEPDSLSPSCPGSYQKAEIIRRPGELRGEKAMAPHSSTLAWEIPWTEEPGRLQSMGSLGVGHD